MVSDIGCNEFSADFGKGWVTLIFAESEVTVENNTHIVPEIPQHTR